MSKALLLAGFVLAHSSTVWAGDPCEKGESAVLVQDLGSGRKLYVCSEGNAASRKRVDVSAFKLYDVSRDEKKLLLENGSEISHFQISKERNGLSVTSLLWLPAPGGKGGDQPFTRVHVSCKEGVCAVTPKECALKIRRNPFPEARAELARREQKDEKIGGKPAMRDDSLSAELLAQGLSGDEAALKDFHSIEERFLLDGAAAEDYHLLLSALNEAKALSCPEHAKR